MLSLFLNVLKNWTHSWLYWLAQMGGWLVMFGLSLFINYSTEKMDGRTVILIATVYACAFLISHTFRTIILRKKVMDKPMGKQIFFLLVMLFIGAILQSVLQVSFTILITDVPLENELTVSLSIIYIINWLIIYLVWMMLYMFYQVLQKQRSKIIQELKLTALKNEIELTNLKAQLNPHFMFNSMNSIRALIDENPQTAKTAVTKLSGLLRNSLQYSKRNYVKFRDELELVNDYLFLEKMRFEERLDFNFNIDQQTLEINFPPLMLQTIVENAIKHGISQLPEGGMVSIMAKKYDEHYEIEVTNSGRLNQPPGAGGIGIANTMKRLRILYGNGANIELFAAGPLVHCKIVIPA